MSAELEQLVYVLIYVLILLGIIYLLLGVLLLLRLAISPPKQAANATVDAAKIQADALRDVAATQLRIANSQRERDGLPPLE